MCAYNFVVMRPKFTGLSLLNATVNIHRVSKKSQNHFSHNFVKFSPTLIIFGTNIAKTTELCKVNLFSTSPNLCQRTTM